jgi:bla regulator protein blaR1
MLKRYLIIILLLQAFFFKIQAQTDIVAAASEYVNAVNYGEKIELKRFFQNEMHYPETAIKNKVEGTVVLSFVVDSKLGTTSLLKVKSSVSKELDEEAIRLYKMLLFTPTYYKGDRVTTYSTLTVKFSIKKYKKYCKKRGYEKIDFSDEKVDYTSNTIYKDDETTTKAKATFVDTLENISRFIYRNLKYPEGTLKMNITGVVKLFFVVEPTGRITNIKTIKSLGGGATNEAIRILKLISWKSGTIEDRKVRVSKQFEVNFNLSNDSEFKYVPGQM